MCAKVIDKGTFWSRVANNREKPDSLVREVLAQAMLSQGRDYYMRKKDDPPPPPFVLENFPLVLLFGIFETAHEFTIELELMREHDLFEELRAEASSQRARPAG